MSATDPKPIPSGSPDGAGDPLFTPTKFQLKAEEAIRAMEAIEADLPFFQQHHPASVPFITAHRSVPDAFLATTVGSVNQESTLQRPGAPATDRGREVLQFVDAYKQVTVRARQFMRNLRFTVDLERANLASDCLTTYALAQRLAKDPANGNLGEHVLAMKRDLGRALRRRKKGTQTPSSPPAPVPTTPATTPPSTATPPANINPPATPVNGAAGH
jgi:hypothetical protein